MSTSTAARLTPTDKGRILVPFLQNFFSRYVQYDFTADLEEQLDKISNGDLNWKEVLRAFWKDLEEALKHTDDFGQREVIDTLNEVLAPYVFPPREDGSEPRVCPRCGDGELSLKLSRNGAFVGCSNYPDCGYTRQLGDKAADGVDDATGGSGLLGKDPETGEDITLKSGRFGPYVERGEGKKATSSLPDGWKAEEMDLEKALKLLTLPRTVGTHPEKGEEIVARFARYGPVIQMGKEYRNLPEQNDVFDIGINRAVALLAEPAQRGRGRAAPKPPLKDLGEHPELGGPMAVKDGRFGPYVAWNKINATLPKSIAAADITVEQAVDLLREKAEKSGKSLKPAAKKAAAKKPTRKTAASKTTAKKATAKKPAAKKSAGKVRKTPEKAEA